MVHFFLQNSLTRLLARDFRAFLHFFPFFEFPRVDPRFEEHSRFSFGQVIFNFLQFELRLIFLGNTSLQPEVEQTKSNYILECSASKQMWYSIVRLEKKYFTRTVLTRISSHWFTWTGPSIAFSNYFRSCLCSCPCSTFIFAGSSVLPLRPNTVDSL